MMPLILTTPLRVLVIGAGKAGLIKVRSALRYQQDVTLISIEFSEAIQAEPCRRLEGDFYDMTANDMTDWDLIYLAIPWPDCLQKQDLIKAWTEEVIARNKLLCVSCRPALGNVVNPCSRRAGEYTLTLSGADMRPKHTKSLTEQLAQHFALMLKDKEIDEKIATL